MVCYSYCFLFILLENIIEHRILIILIKIFIILSLILLIVGIFMIFKFDFVPVADQASILEAAAGLKEWQL